MATSESDLREEIQQFRISSNITVDESTEATRDAIAGICSSDTVRGAGYINAHAHTAGYIRDNIGRLLDSDCFSSPNRTMDVLRSEITAFARISGGNEANITRSFERMAAVPGHRDSESEVNVLELVSRVWTLAVAMDTPAYQAIVVSCLSDNIGDGGGCMPGVTARLFGPYAQMLLALYQDALNINEIFGLNPAESAAVSHQTTCQENGDGASADVHEEVADNVVELDCEAQGQTAEARTPRGSDRPRI